MWKKIIRRKDAINEGGDDIFSNKHKILCGTDNIPCFLEARIVSQYIMQTRKGKGVVQQLATSTQNCFWLNKE